MRVLMLQAATCNQIALVDERLDNGFIGVTLVALLGDDALALKARGFLGVDAVIIDGERDAGVDAALGELAAIRHPDFKILAAMGWGGVDEARARIIGNVIAVEKGHWKHIASFSRPGEGVAEGDG